MQLTNGDLYWQKNSKIKNTYPYLTHDTNVDVLIIGGGLTGAITAYFLANEGASVIVAEKNIIGFGCTSGIHATLEYDLDIDLYKLEKMIGTTQARKVYKLCLDAIDKLEDIDSHFENGTGFTKLDSIYYSNRFMNKQSMSKEFYSRKEAGFNPYFLQNHELLNLSTAILTKNSSGIMNPYLFTQELFDYLSNFENVRILENTDIVDITPGYEIVECKTNNNFKIIADKVIFTNGIDSLKYLEHVDLPIDIYKNFTIVTNKLDSLKKYNTNFTAKESSDTYHTIRFTPNNRIIYTGESVKFNDKFNNDKILNNISEEKYKKLFQSMKKTFNNMPDLKLDYAFNTTLANTKDTLPIIDEIPGMSNCFMNLGFSENGILFSVVGANMLKDVIKGYYTKDMNMFRVNR